MNANSLYLDLLGCQVYIHQGKKYATRVIEAGAGPVLIMMHGGGGHAEAYSRNFARLARRFRVMAVDFIWHGFALKTPLPEGKRPRQVHQPNLGSLDSIGEPQRSLEGETP